MTPSPEPLPESLPERLPERLPDEILRHYDHDYDEASRITQGLGSLELLRTREIVRRHLPEGPLRILDVGGGTGVHAAWLAEDGHEVLFDPGFRAMVERDLRDGQHRNPERRPHWFTTAYLHHPDGLRAEVGDAGLDLVELVGVEGMAAWLPHLAHRLDDPADRDVILWSARAIESEPSLLGLSPHLLAVARRG